MTQCSNKHIREYTKSVNTYYVKMMRSHNQVPTRPTMQSAKPSLTFTAIFSLEELIDTSPHVDG